MDAYHKLHSGYAMQEMPSSCNNVSKRRKRVVECNAIGKVDSWRAILDEYGLKLGHLVRDQVF